MLICVDLTASFLGTYSVQGSFVPGDMSTIILDALANDRVLHHRTGNCPRPSQTSMNYRTMGPCTCNLFFLHWSETSQNKRRKFNIQNTSQKIHISSFTLLPTWSRRAVCSVSKECCSCSQNMEEALALIIWSWSA